MNKEKIAAFFVKNKTIIILTACLILGLLLVFFPERDKSAHSENDYAFRLEEKLVSLVSSIEGVDDVKIILVLESSGETVYSSSNLVDTKTPQVRGVAVVCKNGNNSSVKLKVVNVIRAITGLSSNKISVCE